MALVLLAACTSEPAAERATAVVLEPPPPVAAPMPVRRTRSLQLEGAWGTGSPPCDFPCTVAAVGRVEATSARDGHAAALAVDGDPATSWCGVRGRRDQLLVHFDPPVALDALVVQAPGVAKLALTSSAWDEAAVTLGPPVAEASPPWVTLGLAEVAVLNLEIAALHEGGSGCIDEIAFTTRGAQ